MTFVNKAAEMLYGRSGSELVGEPFGFPIKAESITEIELELPQGGKRSAEMRAAAIDWEGESAWLASIRDVTDRKRAEELQRRLYHADRLASIGQLASGVAHEINNPATFIQGNLELLQEQVALVVRVTGEIQNQLKTVGDHNSSQLVAELLDRHQLPTTIDEMSRMVSDNLVGIERITKIVRALSSFSRIERDEIELVDINQIVEDACSITYNEIRHRAQLCKELGRVPAIVGDRGKLAQVFTNLLINAAHAIAPGAADRNRIRVATYSNQDTVVVKVEDTGSGIPEEIRKRIFSPFFTTKPRGQGTGLGLPLSADIIEKHDGRIEVTSTVGLGTCFKVRLPIKSRSRLTVHSGIEDKEPLRKHRRARLLVIDDEQMLLDSLHRMLRRAHDVVTAAGGVEAIAQLESDADFDVLICDL
ncbi:MAG: ATP-binding protein, partial [Myxococcota bacterium]